MIETPQIAEVINISIKMVFYDVQSKFFSLLLVLASIGFKHRLFLPLFQQLTIIYLSPLFRRFNKLVGFCCFVVCVFSRSVLCFSLQLDQLIKVQCWKPASSETDVISVFSGV